MSLPKSKLTVKVLNPLPGHRDYMLLAHAERLVRHGRAHFEAGRVVMHRVVSRPKHQHRGSNLMVEAFEGFDAMPGRAIMPFWPRASV